MRDAIPRCRKRRRVVVQRWPAVPTLPNTTARSARSRFASSITTMALLPPSSRMVRPSRRATTSATCRPACVEPVKLTSGMFRSSIMRSPTERPSPITRLKTPLRPWRSNTRLQIFCTAMAVSGVLDDGFQITQSPHTAAIMAFHAHTATGKLKALTTPTTPRGCHCSYMRWPGRSLCMVKP